MQTPAIASPHKDPKSVVDHGSKDSPANKESISKQPTTNKVRCRESALTIRFLSSVQYFVLISCCVSVIFQKTFSREDVASLKARLQKLKGQAEAPSSPTPAPVSALAELKARLDSARELAVKAQQRKEEKRVVEEEKSSEEQTQNHKVTEG